MKIGELVASLDLDDSKFQIELNKTTNTFKSHLKNWKKYSAVQANQLVELYKNAFSAISNTMKSTFDSAEKYAKSLDIESTFNKITASYQINNKKMLAEMRAATQNTLTDVKLQATATQSLISGIKYDQLITTLKYLRAYANATGKDFEQLASTIITGLQRGSTQLLDDASIILNTTQIQEQAALKLGHALSDQEAKAALVSAAIDQMNAKLPLLATNADTAASKMARLRTTYENFRINKLGKASLFLLNTLRLIWNGWEFIGNSAMRSFETVKYGFNQFSLYARKVWLKLLDWLSQKMASWADGIASSLTKLPLPKSIESGLQSWADGLKSGAKASTQEINALGAAMKKNTEDHLARLKDLADQQRQLEKENAQIFQDFKTHDTSDVKPVAIPKQESGQTSTKKAIEKDAEQKLLYTERIGNAAEANYTRLVTFADGWRDSCANMAKDAYDMAKAGQQAAQEMASSMSDAMSDGFFNIMTGKFDDLSDTLNSFVESVAKSMLKIQTDQMATNITSYLGSFFHSGGIVGKDSPTFKRAVNPLIFAGAPRFHNGLMPDEFPAILQKGEAVIPKDIVKSSGKNSSSGISEIEINVHNESGEKMKVKRTESNIDAQKLIVDMWLDAFQRNKSGLRSALAG